MAGLFICGGKAVWWHNSDPTFSLWVTPIFKRVRLETLSWQGEVFEAEDDDFLFARNSSSTLKTLYMKKPSESGDALSWFLIFAQSLCNMVLEYYRWECVDGLWKWLDPLHPYHSTGGHPMFLPELRDVSIIYSLEHARAGFDDDLDDEGECQINTEMMDLLIDRQTLGRPLRINFVNGEAPRWMESEIIGRVKDLAAKGLTLEIYHRGELVSYNNPSSEE
ncbi:hypothetical protein NP233_g3967 [Leucocoprinus birnbaumii]|uniref:Uncharacterized protein n=1 Tax=Leucocoprinus birnbaumii TaxID=56174 RepID=A0AAD5YXL2_9AGAR|nr:hypothetical protein NP233_g3967 [Leucocoprinus birnbaumii]